MTTRPFRFRRSNRVRVVEPNIYERVPLTGLLSQRSPTRWIVKISDHYLGSFSLEQARRERDAYRASRAPSQ